MTQNLIIKCTYYFKQANRRFYRPILTYEKYQEKTPSKVKIYNLFIQK